MKVLDLFSGIGGFSLGLERAGMTTVAFCEIEPYCQAVLKKHWPGVPIYDDIRSLSRTRLARDGIIDELADTESERCGEARQHSQRHQERITSSRNVSDTITVRCNETRTWQPEPSGQIDVICGGFPCQDISTAGKGAGIEGSRSGLWSEYARLIGEIQPRFVIVENVSALLGRGLERVLGDLAALGYDAEWHCIPASYVGAPHRRDRVWIVAYPNSGGCARPNMEREFPRRAEAIRTGETFNEADWFSQSGMGRVAHGVPARVDRLKALGNAVVPQIPEIIGKAIVEQEKQP